MNVYFTSDLHFFHARSLEIMPNRAEVLGVSSVEEMGEALISRYNSVITDSDVCIHLGDYCMGIKSVNVPNITKRLNGRKILVMGNHDAGFEDKREGKKEAGIQLYLDSGFEAVYEGVVSLEHVLLEANAYNLELPYNINLCHFPYDNIKDHVANRKFEFPNFSETLLCHGHNHSREHITWFNQIHVGIDADMWDYRPVSLQQILDCKSRIDSFLLDMTKTLS